jgi:hypothetical protein
MRSIRRLAAELHELGDSDTIKNFESFMLECTKIMDALAQGVRLDSIKPKRFDPSMREGIVKSLPDLEQAMLEAQETLPLEVTAQLILIYLDAGVRELLTPTLLELVEGILELDRAGQLTVGAE